MFIVLLKLVTNTVLRKLVTRITMLVACLLFVCFPVLPNVYLVLVVSILLHDRNSEHLSIVSLCLPPVSGGIYVLT